MQYQNLPTLHAQYHGCWVHGNAGSKGISKHGTKSFGPVYSGFRRIRMKVFIFLKSDSQWTSENLIRFIELHAYQACCQILWNLDMQVCVYWSSNLHIKTWRPNSRVTNPGNNRQSTRQKRIYKGQCRLCARQENILPMIKIYHMNE